MEVQAASSDDGRIRLPIGLTERAVTATEVTDTFVYTRRTLKRK